MKRDFQLNLKPSLLEPFSNYYLDDYTPYMSIISSWYFEQIANIIDIGIDNRFNLELKSIEINNDSLIINLEIEIFEEEKVEDKNELFEYISDLLADPDDDGNFPVLINNTEYLVYSKIYNII
jgi:hypothetical protein